MSRHGDTCHAYAYLVYVAHRLIDCFLYSDLNDFHVHNPLRSTHWDSLEKALTVFILPLSSSFYKGTRRRLDLIFTLPEVYWTAVVGW